MSCCIERRGSDKEDVLLGDKILQIVVDRVVNFCH